MAGRDQSGARLTGRLTPVWDAMRSIGSTRERVAELACEVRHIPMPDAAVELGFGREDTHPALYHALVAILNPREVSELADLIRLEPFNQDLVDQYKREGEQILREQEQARKAAARFMLDDPHLQAQREGWGL